MRSASRSVILMLLGAALLAPLAAPAADEDPCVRDDRVRREFDDFGKAVSREAARLIDEVPGLHPDAARLLKSKRWAVAATPIGCLFGDPLTGMLLERTAYMDLHTLVAAKKEAAAHGIPPERLARFVAWWRLPSVLHEFGHIARHRELAARGFRCERATLETEVLARHEEARTLRAMEKHDPGLFAKSRSLEYGPKSYADVLGPYATEPSGLFEAAREDSPALRHVQDTSHEEMTAALADRERASDIPEPRGPGRWEDRHNTVRHITAAINDVCRKEFEDPERYAAYRKALKEMLEAEAARWLRDNPSAREGER